MAFRHARLLSIVTALTAPEVVAASVPECAVSGKGYDDPSVLSMNGGSPADAASCQELCGAAVSCEFFTFFNDTKGCWLLGKDATFRSPAQPFDIYAVSGPKKCGGDRSEEPNWDKPTVAPGIEVTATGVRTIGLGSGPNASATANVTAGEADMGIHASLSSAKEVREETKKYYGLEWYWWVVSALAVATVCSCVACCCARASGSKKKGRGITVDPEAPAAAEAESAPLIMQDAGLMRPVLQVPQLAAPTLMMPQLVSVPASQARAPMVAQPGQYMPAPMSPVQAPYVQQAYY